MQIERVKNEVTKRFKELRVGMPFMFKDDFANNIYIKTYSFISNEFDELKENWDGEESYNAFALRTGDPFWCNDFAEVIIPNCKVVIE